MEEKTAGVSGVSSGEKTLRVVVKDDPEHSFLLFHLPIQKRLAMLGLRLRAWPTQQVGLLSMGSAS